MKDKRVLMAATVPSMIGQFNMNNIRILLDSGYQVDVAADFTDTSVWPQERIEKFREELAALGIECFQLDFSRSPFRLKRHIESYKETKALILDRKYAFIHTHTPIASAIVRMAAKKNSTKTIYTAHGFHFYKGAPLKNWMVYYPIEKILSKYTDILITINIEDYSRAKERFHAKLTEYVPGVGVDTSRFAPKEDRRKKIREELMISDSRKMLLSVGELNENKNHEAVIRAISGMDLVYVIVGKGKLKEKLSNIASEADVDLRLMGFREDVADFYSAADFYILPSIREGLNVSLMEAMASGLPCLAGDIRGNRDLIDEKGGVRFNPKKTDDIKAAVSEIVSDGKSREKGAYNREKIAAFDVSQVNKKMRELYGSL